MKNLLLFASIVFSSNFCISCNFISSTPDISQNKGNIESNEITESQNIETIDKNAIIKAWEKHVEFEGVKDSPKEYTLKDIDNDGNNEIIIRGGGFNAIFSNNNGNIALIAKSFGEFETLSITDDGFVCLNQESGRSAELFDKTYFKLKNSKVKTILCHSVTCDDDNEEITFTTYTLSNGTRQKVISEKQSKKYMPTISEKQISEIKDWININE